MSCLNWMHVLRALGWSFLGEGANRECKGHSAGGLCEERSHINEHPAVKYPVTIVVACPSPLGPFPIPSIFPRLFLPRWIFLRFSTIHNLLSFVDCWKVYFNILTLGLWVFVGISETYKYIGERFGCIDFFWCSCVHFVTIMAILEFLCVYRWFFDHFKTVGLETAPISQSLSHSFTTGKWLFASLPRFSHKTSGIYVRCLLRFFEFLSCVLH